MIVVPQVSDAWVEMLCSFCIIHGDDLIGPVGLPGLAAVGGDGLGPIGHYLVTLGVYRPGEAHDDGLAVESVGTLEDAHVAFEFAHHRRLDDAAREAVVHPV